MPFSACGQAGLRRAQRGGPEDAPWQREVVNDDVLISNIHRPTARRATKLMSSGGAGARCAPVTKRRRLCFNLCSRVVRGDVVHREKTIQAALSVKSEEIGLPQERRSTRRRKKKIQMLAARSLARSLRWPRSRAFSASAAGGAAAAGRLYIAGTGESNKLGIGDTKDRESPTLIEALKVCERIARIRYAPTRH
jgi:hypothetical protein